jgi:sialidase-1
MRKTVLLPKLCLVSALAFAQQQAPFKQEIFTGRAGGYEGYRIPALVMTTKGTLLAFCAARKGLGDWDDIDIAMRRSTDGGKTWEPQKIVADRGGMVADNPSPIVDKVTGAVHFLYQVNYAQLYYMRSDDDGKTFSTPVDITGTVHNYRRGWVNDASSKQYGWSVIAPGPGHAIQLKNGRLLVTIWMSPEYRHRPSAIATVYSDDHGKSWKAGELVPEALKHPSEHVAVELADGSVMLNIRSEGDEHRRAYSISKDGISGWSKPALVPDLYEPVCMASLIRLSSQPKQKRNRLLFANPDSSGKPFAPNNKYNMLSRDDLTIKLSYDEGKTWPVKKLLEAGGTGYSDMAVGPDGTAYIVYERAISDGSPRGKRSLYFARFNLEWLTEGQEKYE